MGKPSYTPLWYDHLTGVLLIFNRNLRSEDAISAINEPFLHWPCGENIIARWQLTNNYDLIGPLPPNLVGLLVHKLDVHLAFKALDKALQGCRIGV